MQAGCFAFIFTTSYLATQFFNLISYRISLVLRVPRRAHAMPSTRTRTHAQIQRVKMLTFEVE